MDLDFNETQEMLRRSARDFLLQECPTSLVRQLFLNETGHSPELWRKMADLGWLGVVIPEEYGGSGGTLLDLAVLCEEFGRALLPSAFYSTMAATLAILNGGSDEQKEALLPQVCEGKILLSLALLEVSGSYDLASLTARANRDGDRWLIAGTKLFVPNAHCADYLVVVARTGDGEFGEQGVSALVVPASSTGISMSPMATFGGDRQSEVIFDRVKVGPNAVLGKVGEAWPVVAKTLQQQTALQLADIIGLGQKALDMTAEYVKVRVQFGVPIGVFQAVQHHCANMAIELDAARLLSHEAIWRLSEGLPASQELSMAKGTAPDAVKRLTILAHRLHGGIGYTREYDLHLYSARAKAAEQLLGTPMEHLEIVAKGLGL